MFDVWCLFYGDFFICYMVLKYKYDEFWININLDKIFEIYDCMFCLENLKV